MQCRKKREIVVRGICKSICLAVLLPAVAAAQQAQPDPDSGAQLSEVVITARKTSEDLQHASVAVTTISPEDIMRSGVKDPTDLEWQLPAVEFQTAQSVPDVFIRGVGTYDLQAGVDSAVAYSIDGIYLAHPSAYPPILVDIAQVEEVRGPQGTLYGRNSNGGAIIWETNKPVLGQWDAEAGISSGNYGAFGSDFMVNVPLTDTLATRFAFGTGRHDAYQSNGYDDANNFTGRWRTLFQPLDNLEFIATLDRSRISNDGYAVDACGPGGDLCPAGTTFHPWTGIGPRNPQNYDRIDTWGTYLEANLKLSWGTVTSLSSYRSSDWRSFITSTVGDAEPAYSPEGVLNPLDTNTGYTQGETARQTTQEIRVASLPGSALSWIFGGYFSREEGPYAETLISNGFTFFTTNPELTDESKALFGQVTYSIINGLRVIGGLRYTDEQKSADQTQNGVAENPSEKTSKVTWKAGLEYDLAPQSLLYGSVSTGFKSGGVSEVPDFPGSSQTYGPETITAYQFGNKNRFLGDRVQVNYELFYYDYRGFQTLDGVTDPTGTFPGLFLETLNSQKSEMYGGEIETQFALSAHDRLSFTPTFLHARFIDFDVGGVDDSGHHIEAAGPYTVAASFQHEFVLPASNRIIAKIGTELVGGHYMDNGNAPGSYQPTYTRTTADLTYEDGGGHWSASAYVRNLENTGVIAFYEGDVLGVQDTVRLYPPRTYGLTVHWHL
jgi:iron complex outermembrane receptor protein